MKADTLITIGIIAIIITIIAFIITLGCIENTCTYESKRTHVCYGILKEVYVDDSFAMLDFVNGSCSGITFFPSPNEAYESFDFELLEVGAVYTFVYHLEDNVPRPGNDPWYMDDCPVIDEINRGNHSNYWINDRGCIER